MQTGLFKPHHKHILISTVLIFLAAYFISLLIWLQVKDYYSFGITFISSEMLGLLRGVKLEEIVQNKAHVQVTFSSPFSLKPDMLVDISVKASEYTFNAPLTFGILAALYFMIKRRWRAYAEALFLLASVHLLFVFSLELKLLTEVFIQMDLEPVGRLRLFFTQFLWSFTDNMVIRFEPFLIGLFMFIRFRRP